MTRYEDRQEQRRRRLLERAEKARKEGQAAGDAASRIAGMIPFGQPILVGHHSERRHRRDLRRIDDGMRKSIERTKEAEELERRAAAVGTGGISSDDPEAVQKLREKLRRLGEHQEWMKRVNAEWRNAGKPAPNDAETWAKVGEVLSATPETMNTMRLEMARRWHYQPTPFPSYALTNNSAEMRRVKQRIEELSRTSEAATAEVDHGICKVVENVGENRIQLVFPGKPVEAVRTLLKQWGFRWSPMAMAWQRHLNDAGRLAARSVVEALAKEGPHDTN